MPTKTVLIAEDNADLRAIFVKVFENGKFQVRVAVDGEEALKAIEKEAPDAIILDINMPKKSGLEILNYVHERPELSHVKVVVVTGNFLAQQQPEAEWAHAFLVKPVSIVELMGIAQRLMNE